MLSNLFQDIYIPRQTMIIKYDFITTLFIVETRHFMSNVCYFWNGMYCKGIHLANIIQFCNILKNPE